MCALFAVCQKGALGAGAAHAGGFHLPVQVPLLRRSLPGLTALGPLSQGHNPPARARLLLRLCPAGTSDSRRGWVLFPGQWRLESDRRAVFFCLVYPLTGCEAFQLGPALPHRSPRDRIPKGLQHRPGKLDGRTERA